MLGRTGGGTDRAGFDGWDERVHGRRVPKVVPAALAERITEARDRGNGFAVSVWTGASTAPELDGLLAAADGIELRMPYQSDPVSRAKINAGAIGYMDVHLSM